MKKTLKKLTPFISIIFFGVALWFLDQELRQYEFSEITAQLREIPNRYILMSLGLSFLSYLVLTVYDALGVWYIGEELPPGKIIRAGFVGYAFSHNIGMALITGGSIRYRIYSAWGFSGLQVTQIVAFSAFTLWIGFCMVAGLALLFATPDLPSDVVVPFVSLRVLGILLLTMVVGYIVASATFRNQFTFKNWTFTFPDFKLSLKQVVIASVDWLMAASVLYVLLPDVGINFFSFVGVFLLAQMVGLFSQVPGGLGVFESVMLVYLSNVMPGSQVLGTLVVYRIIYYVLPLLGALLVLGYQEYIVNRKKVKEIREKATDWVPRVIPQVMSFSVFLAGTILLFSGALPADVSSMYFLQHFIPLPVIEMSHFFASLVGAALLVLASALQRRSDGAYHLTIGLLIFGILFSLLKGADFVEATYLALMLFALIPCRDEFHRKTSMLAQGFSPRWFTMILMVLASMIWLGLFSYRNVEYQRELWWEFSLMGDAPRYLRATVAAFGFALIFGLIKLLRPHQKVAREPLDQELVSAREVLSQSTSAKARLVLLKDKELMFNEDHTSFIMFAKEGRSCVSFGDPVGSEEDGEEMIWMYNDRCSDEGYWPIFYRTSDKYLNYYMDLGLTIFKLGEEARVPLQDFKIESLDEHIYANYRSVEEAGYSWEIIPAGSIAPFMEELKAISEASDTKQKRKRQGFSVGYFDEEYLKNFPVAIVKKGNQLVAFSNILEGANRHELTNDLLRYTPKAPEGIIEYMLVSTMIWGKERGFNCYNLGMAPLSGMKDHEYSPSWKRMAEFIYTYGDNIYGFKSVRMYKSRFNPVWEPKYLVCPGGWAMPRMLSNITSVASGGYKTLVGNKKGSVKLNVLW